MGAVVGQITVFGVPMWIESHQEIARHPKTIKLMRLLGVSRATAIGHLHMLWWWCMDYAQDGDLSRYERADIAFAADWDGDPQQFCAALAQAAWLDERTDGGMSVHDWADTGGRLLAIRQKSRERTRTVRERYANEKRTYGATGQDRTGQDRTGQDKTNVKGMGASQATPPQRAGRLPEDWRPTEALTAWTKANCPGILVDSEIENFRDYWLSKGGEGAVKLDWDRTWKTWCRKAAIWAGNGKGGSHGGGSLQEMADEEGAAIERLKAEGRWVL